MIPSGQARIAGVMGWPVSHSLSPRLHNFWLREHGIDGLYAPLAVSPDDITDAIRALPKLGFAGANVTIPHKEVAFGLMDRLDSAAQRVGAVNTIVVAPDGSLDGSNSDGFGFMENLRDGAPGWNAVGGPAVLLGAGGAARAIAAALLDAGAPELRLANRTRARAEALADVLAGLEPRARIVVVDWTARDSALDGASLVVNCSSLGMAGQPPLDISLAALPASAVVTDIVYTPLETGLLAAARSRGLVAVDGLGMLLHQARPGFAAWFGVMPDVTDALRRAVLAPDPAPAGADKRP